MKRNLTRRLQMMKVVTPDRACDGCRLCCKLLSVEEGDFVTPAGQWCEHNCDAGCAVWDQGPPIRPKACATYTCAWLGGLFLDVHRPDKSKVVVHQEVHVWDGDELRPLATDEAIEDRETRTIWVMTEAMPGVCAQEGSRAWELLQWLRTQTTHHVVVIHEPHKERTVYPYGLPPQRVPFTGDMEAPGA